jgi:hypothetical protein
MAAAENAAIQTQAAVTAAQSIIRREETERRVAQAIAELQAEGVEGAALTIKAISERSGIPRRTLYEDHLRGIIAAARSVPTRVWAGTTHIYLFVSCSCPYTGLNADRRGAAGLDGGRCGPLPSSCPGVGPTLATGRPARRRARRRWNVRSHPGGSAVSANAPLLGYDLSVCDRRWMVRWGSPLRAGKELLNPARRVAVQHSGRVARGDKPTPPGPTVRPRLPAGRRHLLTAGAIRSA